jgi:hypothetical protein
MNVPFLQMRWLRRKVPLHKIGKTTKKVNEKRVEQRLTAGKQDVTTGISISETGDTRQW